MGGTSSWWEEREVGGRSVKLLVVCAAQLSPLALASSFSPLRSMALSVLLSLYLCSWPQFGLLLASPVLLEHP